MEENLGPVSNALKKSLAYGLICVPVFAMFVQDAASSQQQASYEGQSAQLAPDELNALVAPIALYPDALVAQVLGAATFPDQVAAANSWFLT